MVRNEILFDVNTVWQVWNKQNAPKIDSLLFWSDHSSRNHVSIGYYNDDLEKTILTFNEFCCGYEHTEDEIDDVYAWTNLPQAKDMWKPYLESSNKKGVVSGTREESVHCGHEKEQEF
jgi:hypothetical protein